MGSHGSTMTRGKRSGTESLISVIVPVYDVESYLDKCVQSILSQTWENFELILIDDGSPDRCGEMCDDYAKLDSRVVVIHQENAGLSAARNAGLDIMRGHFVTFIDSDDWVDSRYLEVLIQACIEEDSDLSMCEHLRVMQGESAEPFVPGETEVVTGYTSVVRLVSRIDGGMPEFSWGKVYRRELFSEIRFPAGRLHEDLWTTYRILLSANHMAVSNAILYYYLQRPDSIMGTGFSLASRFDLMEGTLERRNALESRGINYDRNWEDSNLFGWFLRANAHVAGMKEGRSLDADRLEHVRVRLVQDSPPRRHKIVYRIAGISPRLVGLMYMKAMK